MGVAAGRVEILCCLDRSAIRRKSEGKPVASHFNIPGHSSDNLIVMVIDLLLTQGTVLRKIPEVTNTGST